MFGMLFLQTRYSLIEADLTSRSVVEAQLTEVAAHMEASLSKALKLETGLPLFTHNTHYLETEEKKWLQQYASARYHSDRYHIYQPRPVLQEAYPIAYEKPTVAVGRRTPSPVRRTRTDEELDVMAKVQAYVQVAYKVCGPWTSVFPRLTVT